MPRTEESLAIRDAALTIERLRALFGEVPPVVYFVQRKPDGPVKIGQTTSLTALFARFYNAAPDPVLVRAVVPGSQPLEHWFHRRHADRALFGEWYELPELVVADADAFGFTQLEEFQASGDLKAATLDALRLLDPELADIERLYRNGVPHRRIAEMADLSESVTRARIEKMRALGFDLRIRRAPSSRSVRFDTAAGAGGLRARHVG